MTRAETEVNYGRTICDPVDHQEFWLGRRLWAKQREIVESVKRYPLVAVKGCHASGKTYCASGLPLQHLDEHKNGLCLTTAPTLRQVKLFWGEIALARRGARGQLRQRIPEPSTTMLKIAEDRYAIGASSSKGVNVQGFHAANVLIIADESPGILQEIWDAIEGIRLGGRVSVLKMGNPTVPSGPFFDAFNKERAVHKCISISAFDTPNLQDEKTGKPLTIEQLTTMSEERLDFAPFPSLITRRGVLDRYKAWGPTNPRYKSRVLAEFPTQSQRAVYDLAWIERAKREPTEEELARVEDKIIQVGVDVAGEGSDETTACARINGIIIARAAWPEADPRDDVVRWISQLNGTLGCPLGAIVVDTVGIGYYFAKHLAGHFPGLVWSFKAGGRAIDVEQYADIKAESYFRLRDMLKEDYISQVPSAIDEHCEAQLSSIEYEELPRGVIRIEPKDEARKRGVQSPDRAEAQVLAFCKIVPREQRQTFGGDYSISPI